MYAHKYGTGGQATTPNSAYGTTPGYTVNPAFVPPPGFITAPAPAVPSQVQTPNPFSVPSPRHTPTPPLPVLAPVQVPPGCYPIELVQFWRNEYKRGQPFPLHWALFVRTAPQSPSPTSSTHAALAGSAWASLRPGHHVLSGTMPHGNYYELAGNVDTYTAQFLASVTFSPETLPDWRGTHVIGWVHPTQLATFERVVRQVQVWRHRPDWRCQHWVYEVVRAIGGGQQGLFTDGATFANLQKHMAKLLEAWENGDI